MSVSVRVGELLVNITANAGGFVKPVKQSRSELKGFQTDVKQTSSILAGLRSSLALIGGSLTFAGAIASARSYMRELDAVGKSAAKLGVDTRDLMALRFGGEQSGLGPNVIDKALQKLSQRISEVATTGKGEAVDVLKELKVNVEALSKLTADQQLNAIADAMLGIANQGDKIRIATKLFEEEGVGLLNLLSRGSSGLREFRDEAKRMGIDFGTEAVAGIEKANDAINRLRVSMNAIGQKIVIELAPGVESVANKLTTAVKEFRESPVGIMGDSRTKPSVMGDAMSAVGGAIGWTWGGAKGLYSGYYSQIMDFEARRQIRKGDGAGTPALASDPMNPVWGSTNRPLDRRLNFLEGDLARLERSQEDWRRAQAAGLVYLRDRGKTAIGQLGQWAQGDGAKGLGEIAKQFQAAQQGLKDTLRGAAIESLIRPPGWRAERERNAEARREREKAKLERRRELEDRLRPQGITAINSAIEANTAEAFRVIAENKVAKAHLDVAREAKKILDSIDKGIDRIAIEGVGL